MNDSQNPSALRSKALITESLLKLMHEMPYDEITVKRIILDTDLVRKTFYRNFESKDDVLDSIINKAIDEYVGALENTSDDPLTVIFNFCRLKKDLFSILQKNNMLYLLLLKLNEKLPQISKTTDPDKNPFVKLMSGLEPDYLIAFNIGAIWNIISLWVERGMKEDPSEIRHLIEKYLKRLAGLEKDKKRASSK
ncbi:MAG: TetR/AcrR family transcriptional regulator [Lachnospiraceae bacterium]|nr:TetR/AcrR family transcriptional regulator [Lachnospiraceae bacterium]